ncbi:MAG: hypothetical protein ACYC7M_09175 [Bellilinea sp.]
MLKNFSARPASGIQILIFGPWLVWKVRLPERQVQPGCQLLGGTLRRSKELAGRPSIIPARCGPWCGSKYT